MKFNIFYIIGFLILLINIGFWATVGIACIVVPMALELDKVIMRRR